jgi:2-phosphoglycerate kinase
MRSIVYCQSPNVLQRQVAREVLITRVDYGAVDSLGGTAFDAWRLLERPLTAEQLSASLAEGYRLDAEQIRQDVENLLEGLVQRQWVTTLERA